MVSNPIQRKQRNSMLMGIVVGLAIGLLLCGALYMFLQSSIKAGVTNKNDAVTVAVLNKSIKSGTELTVADFTIKQVNKENAPADYVNALNGAVIAKIDLTAGTILSNSMITTSDSKVTNDLRVQEYNMITLPTQLTAGSYIDIRLQMPDGGDYIVISKKYVQNANSSTVWLKMNEEEILTMSNAIIEYYIMTGSKLYATTYTDPGAQQAATPTYVPNATVSDLVRNNPNITSIIEGRYTSELINIRNSRIKTQLDKYNDTGLENLEKSIQEEIKSLQETRQAYFGALNAAN